MTSVADNVTHKPTETNNIITKQLSTDQGVPMRKLFLEDYVLIGVILIFDTAKSQSQTLATSSKNKKLQFS